MNDVDNLQSQINGLTDAIRNIHPKLEQADNRAKSLEYKVAGLQASMGRVSGRIVALEARLEQPFEISKCPNCNPPVPQKLRFVAGRIEEIASRLRKYFINDSRSNSRPAYRDWIPWTDRIAVHSADAGFRDRIIELLNRYEADDAS
jgi:hypothetical protein